MKSGYEKSVAVLLCLSLFVSFSFSNTIKSTAGEIELDTNSDDTIDSIITSTGIGINTSSIDAELHVQGNAYIESGSLNIGVTSGKSSLQIDGTLGFGVQTVSTNTTLSNNTVVMADTSNGKITLTLPDALSVLGREYFIKKTTSANRLVVRGGGSIDTFAALTFLGNVGNTRPYLHVISGANNQWYINAINGATNLTTSENLIAWWGFDETSGNALTDLSGNDFDGTLKNSMTFSANGTAGGVFDRALYIDGPNNDYVDIPYTVLEGRTNLTLSCWIKTTKTGNQGIFSAARSHNPDNELLMFLSSQTHFQFHDNNTSVSWSGLSSVADGNWHHLCVVRDDTNDQATFYLDGSSEGSNAITMVALDVTENGVVMGQEQDNVGGGFQASQAFDGTIDDFRIYDRVLSASEINSLYQEGI